MGLTRQLCFAHCIEERVNASEEPCEAPSPIAGMDTQVPTQTVSILPAGDARSVGKCSFFS